MPSKEEFRERIKAIGKREQRRAAAIQVRTPPRVLTLQQVLDGADRAAARVAQWPEWKRELSMSMTREKPAKYEIEFEGEPPIVVEEWASLTYLIFPSGDLPGVWVGHCLEVDVVSQGEEGGGPEHALEMTLQAAAITIEFDKREGRDPFDRMAPEEYWPPERLKQWKEIREKLGAEATWENDPELDDG